MFAYLLGNPPAAKGAIGEIRLWLRPADRTASEAFWSGQFDERHVTCLVALLDRGMTAVDVGANVGMVGLRFAARLHELGAGRVLLVEPVPANIRLLNASVQLNGLEGYCTVFGVGLADRTGTATLLAEGGGKSGNAGQLAPEERRYRRLTQTTISYRTLDDLLDDAGEPALDLIKVDIEGAELSFLRGARRSIERHTPFIFGEFHSTLMPRQGGTFIDVMDLLGPFGYKAFTIAGRQHLTEIAPEPDRGDVLLATPARLSQLDAHRGWRIDFLR